MANANVTISGLPSLEIMNDTAVFPVDNSGTTYKMSGANLTSYVLNDVPGSNVSGQVSNSLVSATVYQSAQPNITSVGTLTSLGVTGNITGENVIISGSLTGDGASPAPYLSGFSSISTVGTQGNITATGNLIGNNAIITNNLRTSTILSTGNISGNYILGNGSQLTGLPDTAIVLQGEYHVSPSGSDTTGKGTQSSPYKTINHVLNLPVPFSSKIIVHSGSYNENITIKVSNIVLVAAQSDTGGNPVINGNVTIADTDAGTRVTSIHLAGITVNNLNITSTGTVYLEQSGVLYTITRTGGGYTQFTDCDLELRGTGNSASFTGTSAAVPLTTFFTNTTVNNLRLNANTNTIALNCINLANTLVNGGTLESNSSDLGTISPNEYALTISSNGGYVSLNNGSIFNTARGIGKINTSNGSYSVTSIIYDQASSLLGTEVAVEEYFSRINADIVTVGGNITAGGNIVSANANLGNAVVANFYIGDGGLLSNVNGTYSNANVANFLPLYTGNLGNVNTIITTGNITTTNIVSNGNITVRNIAASGNVQSTKFSVSSSNASYSSNIIIDTLGLSLNTVAPGSSVTMQANANAGFYLNTTGNFNVSTTRKTVFDSEEITQISTGNYNVNARDIRSNATGNFTIAANNMTISNVGDISNVGNISAKSFTGDGSNLSKVVTKVSGTWTVTPGTNVYTITLEPNNAYTVWVGSDTPPPGAELLAYIATVVVLSPNTPVLGVQYAFNYPFTAVEFTAIPNQIVGTPNTIVSVSGSTYVDSNIFKFTLKNSTSNNYIVYWGYSKYTS